MGNQKLSDLQLELLRVYSFTPSEEDLIAIKKMLANYFLEKLQKNVDTAVKEKQITEEDLDKWINE